MELEEWMNNSARRKLVAECDTFEEWKDRENDKMFMDYVRLERCFWTAKNFPKTRVSKTLSYPRLTRASDFFRKIYLHRRTNQTRANSVMNAHYQDKIEGIFLHQDYSGKQINDLLDGERATKECTMWSSFYCKLMAGIEPDVMDEPGGIEIIDRPDGWILIASSTTFIGSDWLGIVKDWDIKLDENFCYG